MWNALIKVAVFPALSFLVEGEDFNGRKGRSLPFPSFASYASLGLHCLLIRPQRGNGMGANRRS